MSKFDKLKTDNHKITELFLIIYSTHIIFKRL